MNGDSLDVERSIEVLPHGTVRLRWSTVTTSIQVELEPLAAAELSRKLSLAALEATRILAGRQRRRQPPP